MSVPAEDGGAFVEEDLVFKRVVIEPGSMEVEAKPSERLREALSAGFLELFADHPDAVNYIEWRVRAAPKDPDEPLLDLVVTVRKVYGLTPSEKLGMLEAKVRALSEVNAAQVQELHRLERKINRLRVAIPAAGPKFPGRAHLRELPLTPEAWEALEDLLR